MERKTRTKIPKARDDRQGEMFGPPTPFEAIDNAVVDRLEAYVQNKGRIKVLEKQARGIGLGLYLDIGPRTQLSDTELKRAVHEKLRGLPEYLYLSAHDQELVGVYRAYLHDQNHTTLIAALRAIRRVKADDEEDEKLLTELARRLAKILDDLRPPIREVDELASARVDARKEAEMEMAELLAEEDVIEEAIKQLGVQDLELEELIKRRYIEGMSVSAVCLKMNIREATFHRKRRKAIGLLARYLGIT